MCYIPLISCHACRILITTIFSHLSSPFPFFAFFLFLDSISFFFCSIAFEAYIFMYSEFNGVFLLNMSNSEFFLIKGDQEGVEFDVLKRPSREFHDESDTAASNDDPAELGQQVITQVVEDADEKEDKFNDPFLSKEPAKFPESGEFKTTDHDDDNDDDGFKTPTSLDHKIPVLTNCPPAPRKSKSFSSTKRKSVSSNVRRSLRLDLSQEIESLFPQPIRDDFHRKIKRARKEN